MNEDAASPKYRRRYNQQASSKHGKLITKPTKNNIVKYSGLAQVKLPGNQRRILGAVYTNDYRSENYDYNDFLIRENPLNSGDEDIAGTIFGLRSAGNMSERQEVTVSFSNDWSSDIESNLFFRSNTYGAGEMLPFASNTVSYDRMKQQSFTLFTRFSFGERVYDDHFQRIYSNNNKPVFYALLEGGRYEVGKKNGNYAKLSGQIRQLVNFNISVEYESSSGFCKYFNKHSSCKFINLLPINTDNFYIM